MIEQYLSQDPDVSEIGLSDHDFVVLASDGLWDVISNQEVVSYTPPAPLPLLHPSCSCFLLLLAPTELRCR